MFDLGYYNIGYKTSNIFFRLAGLIASENLHTIPGYQADYKSLSVMLFFEAILLLLSKFFEIEKPVFFVEFVNNKWSYVSIYNML